MAPTARTRIDREPVRSTPTSFAELEPYILQAEVNTIERPGKQYARKQVFMRGPSGTMPLLRKGQDNRIIIYRGCFNPPHRDHRRLLMHAFLYTDRKTVAAMICPAGESGYHKQRHSPRPLLLTRKQRATLWQDDILGRWSWVFPGRGSEMSGFISEIQNLALLDGYKITFVGLGGSDHFPIDRGSGGRCWDYMDAITSDITRPATILSSDGTRPRRFDGEGAWREILPGRGVNRESQDICWQGERYCWPCAKFKAMYPEFASAKSISALNDVHDDIAAILNLCHAGRGIVWKCERYFKGVRSENFLLFLPSGRNFQSGLDREEISSTAIRQNLLRLTKHSLPSSLTTARENPASHGDECELSFLLEPPETMDESFKRLTKMVLNPLLLLAYVGFHDHWPFARPVDPVECFPCKHWQDWHWDFVQYRNQTELGSERSRVEADGPSESE